MIKIKKQNVIGVLGLIVVTTGMFLVTELIKTLSHYGFIGYLYLIIFSLGLTLIIFYENNHRSKLEIIDQVVKEITLEAEKKGDFYTTDNIKTNLKNHLLKKINEETYVFFGKKS